MTGSSGAEALLDAWNRYAPARALVGAVVGWSIVERWGPQTTETWWAVAAALALAVALVAAPGTDRWAGLGLNSGWAFATAIGVYLCVPETDPIIPTAAVLGIIWLGELSGRVRADGAMIAALLVVLVFVAVDGLGQAGTLIAALALPGLLVVAPAVTLVLGPRADAGLDRGRVALLLALQLAYAIGVARLGGVRTSTSEAIVVVAVSAVLLAVVAAAILARPGRPT